MALKGHGQALVETMIIAPVAIFLMIGAFEIGWLLRGYLVMISANREAARFAVRPSYLDYTPEGYIRVVQHALDVIDDQIPFTETGTIIISVVRIDPQRVCDPDNVEMCDCEQAVTNPFSPTLIMSPLTEATATYKYPATSTEVSRIDYIAKIPESIRENRRLACNLQKSGAIPNIDEQVTVEMVYAQYQLFGFPGWNNPILNPAWLYGHSTFRLIEHR